MKMKFVLTAFLACHINTYGVDTKSFHPSMSSEKVALLANPTTNQAPPDIEKIKTKIEAMLIADASLRLAFTNLFELLKSYIPPRTTNKVSSTDSTYCLHSAAREVYLYYTHYQQMFGRDGLEADLKSVTEDALLCALKKMEWVSQRKENPKDNYFHCYYYTLLRYMEVCQGWLILNGAWTKVPTERN